MNRSEFMKQLERLLQDVPAEDREEALEYYESYFADAGPERESAVIQELGSPGRVAAEIKAGLKNDRESGQFTDRGYEDERFTDRDLPNGRRKGRFSKNDKEKGKNLLLMVLLLIVTFPIWSTVLGAVCSLFLGVFGAMIAVVMAAFVVALVMVVLCVACLVLGVTYLGTSMGIGICVIGAGLMSLALGIVSFTILSWLLFKGIPALLRLAVDLIQKLIRKLRGGKKR